MVCDCVSDVSPQGVQLLEGAESHHPGPRLPPGLAEEGAGESHQENGEFGARTEGAILQ